MPRICIPEFVPRYQIQGGKFRDKGDTKVKKNTGEKIERYTPTGAARKITCRIQQPRVWTEYRQVSHNLSLLATCRQELPNLTECQQTPHSTSPVALFSRQASHSILPATFGSRRCGQNADRCRILRYEAADVVVSEAAVAARCTAPAISHTSAQPIYNYRWQHKSQCLF